MFNSEAEFEAALIKKLTDECGWDKKILRNYSEKDLIKNWADILFQNNRNLFYTIFMKNKSIFEQYLSKYKTYFKFFRFCGKEWRRLR